MDQQHLMAAQVVAADILAANMHLISQTSSKIYSAVALAVAALAAAVDVSNSNQITVVLIFVTTWKLALKTHSQA